MGASGKSGEGLESILKQLAERGIDAQGANFRIATSERGDPDVSALIPSLLATIKASLRMDVAFVSRFLEGHRLFEFVDVPHDAPVIEVGGSDPLGDSWCQRVVDGRLPGFIPDTEPHFLAGTVPRAAFPIGTHMSVPVQLATGHVYGTVCCFSFAKSAQAREADLDVLRAVAALIAAGEGKRTAQAG